LHVDEDPDLVSSPPSLKESKEEQRKWKKRAYDAKRRAAKKAPPKNRSPETCSHLFHNSILKMLTT
jgi:hypothetical protein